MIMSKVYETLFDLGLTSESTAEIFSEFTRDLPINVYRDSSSGVIYIKDFYVGDDVYVNGDYRKSDIKSLNDSSSNYEDEEDTNRRISDFKQLISNKRLVDFGCGKGSFLRKALPFAADVAGIELQEDFRRELRKIDIDCFANVAEVKYKPEIITSFHSFEHLGDPLSVLRELYLILQPTSGMIVIEIPHANDFLLKTAACQGFKEFTLWSQHLILHTRDSIRIFLEAAGFSDIFVKSTQRYPISNHFHWLVTGQPGGHKSSLSMIDSSPLFESYKASLSALDQTDTLYAIAKAN